MEYNAENTEECSIKIDTFWSEADGSFPIKEEIVSDVEPDSVNCTEDNTNDSADEPTDLLFEDDSSCNGYPDTSLLPSWQPLKKKVKTRSQKNEESEMVVNHKLSCLHDTKNFKIVKRRLRCGDCKSLVCPECCKVMIPNLQSHFLGSGVCSSGTYLCKLCNIIFRSLCALQAHIRIHTMDTPYVCPDCGLIYNNIYFLILHLLNKCYHVYKIVRYKCKQCPGAYFSPETFVQHIQEKHIHCIYRCLYCSSLFNNYEEFNHHMENLHQKQKVQYLNYFRCSLCSNIVIPRFMYQRHVAQHRENSEYYEVDYQCLCGETYSLIGAFRSHFFYCNKKGVLPPKWSFLQKKLKTHGVVHENFQTKELVIQPSQVRSKNESNFEKLSLIKSNDKVLISDEDKAGNEEILEKRNCGETVKNVGPAMDGKDFSKKEKENSNGKSSNSSDSFKIVAYSNEGTEMEKSIENSKKLDAEISTTNEEPNIQLGEKCTRGAPNKSENNKKTEEQKNSKSSKESEQSDGDISKIYDHIPRDHLGYLIKKQCSEQLKKSSQEDDIIVEKSFPPKTYKIVTELDEKTGIITTKTVPVEEIEVEEDEKINEDDYDMESSNSNSTSQHYCKDKGKYKEGNSVSCPFCIVLFPKHNLTFQQFILHLESYHPDAALNITISKEENKTSDKPDSTGAENKINERNDSEGADECSRSSNFDSSEKEMNCKENQNKGDENSTSLNSVIKPKMNNNGNTISILQNESEEGESSKASETFGVCQSEETPKNKDEESRGSGQSWEVEECQVETVSEHVDLSSFVNEDEKQEKTRGRSDEEEPNKSEKKCDFDRSMENTESSKDGTVEETSDKQNLESEDKISPKSLFDLDYEGETSKDSNWSVIFEKDSKSISPTESKAEEKERSRRESEVWSEFYESLMLAEKLKKRKNPSPESDTKKNSVVSDYSSKRIVKKPKRYRESSESVDSNEISESDEEFLLKNDLIDKIYSEEKGDVENQLNKKQLLMNKLESVNGKFVDYLFDLVTKKEKLFELYKKHSILRANHYSHDLRNYRRKVLNGIKQRGRPLKMLRYHELLKKKELMYERNIKDNYLSKKKSELSPDVKANEKKRGRPRKPHDPAKLKERRRSDKEVDFIEKNFEREESDMSPTKRKRKLSSKLQYYRKISDEKDDFSSGQVISNKPVDSNKKFTCAVCKEVFPEQSEFREHIVTHRMEENTYQCMECGECFVVRPSLEKHLHAFHKVKNTDKYITENECCNIKKEIVEEESEPLKENQCKVCKDQFDRPIDLTKHFRIHGMAFLKEFKKEGKPVDKQNLTKQN